MTTHAKVTCYRCGLLRGYTTRRKLQLGRLAGALDKRCRLEHLTKPNAGRPSIDLDEGLLLAMPVQYRNVPCSIVQQYRLVPYTAVSYYSTIYSASPPLPVTVWI